MMAFLGLLYMSGVLKNNRVNLEELWSEAFGPPLFRASTSLLRFKLITMCIRFDDKSTRPARKVNDPFAPIREIWDLFIENCKTYYTPSEYCTIDEQLLGTRCRCPFKVYIRNKPDKYGIKIVTLCVAKTFYMVDVVPYTGKVNKPSDESVPSYYVRTLTQTIHGTNRNVTMDNWFTSVPLARKMLTDHKLTIVGTLRKNKREIPVSLVSTKGRKLGESRHVYDKETTMVSYIPKQNKSVILISTMHKDDSIDEETGKPEIITFYNQTKGGVDTLDQLCHNYTTARKTRRWPLRVFYGILDQCGVNALILFVNANPQWKEQGKTRRTFLKELSLSLVKQHISVRLCVRTMPRELNMLMSKVIGQDPPEVERNSAAAGSSNLGGTKKRCNFCPRKKDKKNCHPMQFLQETNVP